jgi:hypothetical protein
VAITVGVVFHINHPLPEQSSLCDWIARVWAPPRPDRDLEGATFEPRRHHPKPERANLSAPHPCEFWRQQQANPSSEKASSGFAGVICVVKQQNKIRILKPFGYNT